MKKKVKYIIPSVYFLLGILFWLEFMNLPPDGLANVGIALYVFPTTLLGLLIFGKTFPFISGSYYVSHSIFFFVSLLIITVLIYYFIALIIKFTSRKTYAGKKSSDQAVK